MYRLGSTIVVVASVIGCEAPSVQPKPATAPAATLSPAAAALRERLTNTDNGLEVRRWIVAEQTDRLVSALSAHMDGQAIDAHSAARLKRNGFRFVKVPVDRLDSLLADVGGASYDANEWHGQVHDWRSILDRPISSAGRAVAVDGVVSRYDRGEFRLMLRSWTVQMESGPFVHIEILPRHRIPQTQNFRRLLGDVEQPELGFGSMAIDGQLESGFAYLLLGESPQSHWPGVDPSSESAGSPTDQQNRVGVMESIGPEAVAPPTLGELMLAPNRTDSTRAILVFVPKVADALYLPEQAALRPANQDVDEGAGGG